MLKPWETWENGAFWLAEMGGHMNLQWDLAEKEIMLLFPHAPSFSHMKNGIKALPTYRGDHELSKTFWRMKIWPLLRKLQAFISFFDFFLMWKWWQLAKNWCLSMGVDLVGDLFFVDLLFIDVI